MTPAAQGDSVFLELLPHAPATADDELALVVARTAHSSRVRVDSGHAVAEAAERATRRRA